jgi:hypothetical protein
MAISSGKDCLRAAWFPDSVPGVGGLRDYTYHLFHHHGDAFITLYSEIPENLSVSHAPVLTAGVATFTVAANDSSVIALTVNGEIIGVTEGTGSPVAITIPPQTSGDTMKVTITKANYYRYEADVLIIASTYPYVILSTDIIDDVAGGNSDGLVNPGETIDYGVWAKNIGTGTAQDVYGILTVSNAFVTLNIDSSWYGNIAEDESTLSVPHYNFTVDDSCLNGYEIPFTLYFHDINDSIFTSYRTMMVYAPILTFEGVNVVNDNNSNGILDPGETADIVVTLRNEGGAAAENVTSLLTTASADITINDATGTFGTIIPGDTANNATDPYNVTASSSAPYGTEVDCSIIVQSGVYNDTLDLIVTIGKLVPTDTGYYYAYYSGGPHTESPVFDWFEIAPPGPGSIIPDITNEDADTVTLSLPFTFRYYGQDYTTIGVCSNGFLEFGSSTYRFGDNGAIPSPGGPRAMIAPFWDDLDPSEAGDIYQYYDSAGHRWIIEFYQVDHYGGPGHYETFQVILNDPLYYPTLTDDGEIVVQYLVQMQESNSTFGIEDYSETVGIQYYFNGTYHELAVPVTDSCALKYTTDPPSNTAVQEYEEVVGVPLHTQLNVCYPNPFTDRIEIRYSIGPGAKGIALKIYNATGRLVKSFSQLPNNRSLINHVIWDGTDDSGRKVSAGVYFVRFVADDCEEVEKAILLK